VGDGWSKRSSLFNHNEKLNTTKRIKFPHDKDLLVTVQYEVRGSGKKRRVQHMMVMD